MRRMNSAGISRITVYPGADKNKPKICGLEFSIRATSMLVKVKIKLLCISSLVGMGEGNYQEIKEQQGAQHIRMDRTY